MTQFATIPPPPVESPLVPLAIPVPDRGVLSIWQATALTALALAIQMLLGFFLSILDLLTGVHYIAQTLGIGLINLVMAGVVLAVGAYWGRFPARRIVPLRRVPVSLLMPMTITVLGLSAILSEITNVVGWVLPIPDFLNELLGGLLGNDDQFWQSVILLSVIAPVTEEPIFRGLMLGGTLQRYRPWVAVLATSVLFAALRMNPWQFFPALGLGLLFGWWFVRTRSLWPCLFGHALNNTLPNLASSIPGFEIPGYTGSSLTVVQFQPLWLDLVGLGMFALGIAWTARLFRRMPVPIDATPVEPVVLFPSTNWEAPLAQSFFRRW